MTTIQGIIGRIQGISGRLVTEQHITDRAVAALCTTGQHYRSAPAARDLTENAALVRLFQAAPPECECMLCDLPSDEPHAPATWMLEFDFNRPPAAEFGLGRMLLCDHCVQHWVEEPDEHGGTPVRCFPV